MTDTATGSTTGLSEAEAAENRKDARVAREYEVALPHELNAQQRRELVRGFARELAERHGCALDVAIHAPHREGRRTSGRLHHRRGRSNRLADGKISRRRASGCRRENRPACPDLWPHAFLRRVRPRDGDPRRAGHQLHRDTRATTRGGHRHPWPWDVWIGKPQSRQERCGRGPIRDCTARCRRRAGPRPRPRPEAGIWRRRRSDRGEGRESGRRRLRTRPCTRGVMGRCSPEAAAIPICPT